MGTILATIGKNTSASDSAFSLLSAWLRWTGAILCLWTGNVFADWRPSTEFLRAVRQIESCDGRFIYGDDGRSLGDFQIREGAWADVNQWRKSRGLKTYDYQQHVFNRFINRTYAADYISLLYRQLERQFRREPTPAEIYAAYNMGMTNFGGKCRYDLRRVNAMTARKCNLIAQLLGDKPSKPAVAQVAVQQLARLN